MNKLMVKKGTHKIEFYIALNEIKYLYSNEGIVIFKNLYEELKEKYSWSMSYVTFCKYANRELKPVEPKDINIDIEKLHIWFGKYCFNNLIIGAYYFNVDGNCFMDLLGRENISNDINEHLDYLLSHPSPKTEIQVLEEIIEDQQIKIGNIQRVALSFLEDVNPKINLKGNTMLP